MKAADAEALVRDIRDKIETAWISDQHNRDEARTDLRFVAGIQWEEKELAAREGRPCLTINKMASFVRQVANDIRQNTPAINVFGVDDKADVKTAKIYSGLIRAIEHRSNAAHIYATAGLHVTACGIGHFRVRSEYVDDASFDQDILIDRIIDPLSVYWDPAAVRPDRTDGMWCAVLEQVPVATFRDRYPDAKEDSVDAPDHQHESALVWATDDYVLVAEFWRKVPTKKRVVRVAGETIDVTDIPRRALQKWASENGLTVEAEREIETHRIESVIVSGSEVLSGPHPWAGRFIPIITVVGEEIPVGDQIVRSGLTRPARDPQRLYNYWQSTAAESIGQAPKSPWLVTKKMIARFRSMWDQAGAKAQPYLIYDPDEQAPGGRPTREAPPAPPTAMWQQGQIAADDIKATTGIFDASLGAKGNETSGKAIIARQREGDTANYHITDNLSLAIAHAGRVLIDLIPKIYDTERVVRILGEDDAESMVVINQALEDGTTVNDVSVGRFDVRVRAGPGYATRRQEAADSMMQFAQAVPGAAQVIGDLIAKNMDWPGAEEIATRLKKMLPPQLVDDDPNAVMAPPDPMQQQAEEAQQVAMRLDLEGKAEGVRNQKLVNAKLAAELEHLRIGAEMGQMNGGTYDG